MFRGANFIDSIVVCSWAEGSKMAHRGAKTQRRILCCASFAPPLHLQGSSAPAILGSPSADYSKETGHLDELLGYALSPVGFVHSNLGDVHLELCCCVNDIANNLQPRASVCDRVSAEQDSVDCLCR